MVAESVIGIGWYGEPFQHGRGVFASHSRTLFSASCGCMPSTAASRVSTALPSSGCWSRSVRLAETTSRVSLSAIGTPRSSRIEPRTAGVTTCWMWLLSAFWSYSWPLRIWRYHSRPPRVSSSEKTRTWRMTRRIVIRVFRPVSGMLPTSVALPSASN